METLRNKSAETGIKIIVIGAGYAGLTTAIESIRKGHDVEVFEAAGTLELLGDTVAITPNATRIMRNWGNVLHNFKNMQINRTKMPIHNSAGDILLDQVMLTETDGFPFSLVHRSKGQQYMYDYALSLGIKIHLGARVSEYFEDENQAGIFVNGERHVADAVIGADGVHSKCRHYVTGLVDSPVSSGFAVYRAWYDKSRLGNNPLTREFVDCDDSTDNWIGPDMHFIVSTSTKSHAISWHLTHKDSYSAQETWAYPGKVEDALALIKGWDPRLAEVVKATPKEKLIDWKLLWRDPLKRWVSQGGRIALCGDSAHPFLPSSGNGASQAMEDATCIPTALHLAGKKDVPLALKAFETLRYERVCLAQKAGFETRHRWHKFNEAAFHKNPENIKMPQPNWLYKHDAEAYTIERWDDVVASLKGGLPFLSTNTYDGYVHQDWTIEEAMESEMQIASGERERAWL